MAFVRKNKSALKSQMEENKVIKKLEKEMSISTARRGMMSTSSGKGLPVVGRSSLLESGIGDAQLSRQGSKKRWDKFSQSEAQLKR